MSEKFSLGIKFNIKEPKVKNYSGRVHMEHTNGRNAFYNLQYINMTDGRINVEVHWGRIGTSGRKDPNVFKSKELAKAFFDKKVKEKLEKGYKVIFEPKI